MTKVIGLTGGIGSGKTSIANYFHSLGIPVYIADEESKNLLQSPEISHRIREEFGDSIFENDTLSKHKLAEIVFNDSEALSRLNAIMHPAVKKHFEQWLKQHSEFPIVIKEAAILFESGSYKDCDKIITVTTPVATRIRRVMERDKTSRENVLQRIKNQWSDEQRISKSDYVIENTNITTAYKQADEILKKLTIR